MQEPLLRIALDLSDSVPLLRLTGELDHWSSHELTGDLACIAEAGFAGVVLDLAALRFMDCGGLKAVTAARQNGLQVELCNVPCHVQRLLDLACVPAVEEPRPAAPVVRAMRLTGRTGVRPLVIRQLPLRGQQRQRAAG
jgi:anti-anti-sigma factor